MKTTIATVATLIAAAAAPAFAQDVSVKIDRDLLDTQAGRESVYQELHSVARDACVSELSKRRRMIEVNACSNEIVDSLIDNLNDTRISAIHNGTYQVAGQ